MGNIVEAGGFGDTRVPSDDEDDYDPGQFRPSLDPSMFTYRDGVNYVKEQQELSSDWEVVSNSNNVSPNQVNLGLHKKYQTAAAQCQAYGTSSVPKSILARYLKINKTNHQELEKIWEAYKNLLTDQALVQLSKDQLFEQTIRQSQLAIDLAQQNPEYLGQISTSPFNSMAKSNLHRMISIPKLYQEGKMYMNQEEIQAIQQGQLRQYLSQFLETSNTKMNNGSEALKKDKNERPQSPMIPLIQADGLNHGIQLGNQRISNASRGKSYHPRGSMLNEDLNIPLDDLQSGSDPSSPGFQKDNRFGIVQLEFQDFFDLMKLKIQYQRQSISQNHSLKIQDNTRGTESVEFAAIEAYRKRLTENRAKKQSGIKQHDLDPRRLQGLSQGRSRGINKNTSPAEKQLAFSNPRKAGQSGTVIVETKQQDVSCFLWPIFRQKQTPTYNSFVEPTQSSMNMITSPTFSHQPTQQQQQVPAHIQKIVSMPINEYAEGQVQQPRLIQQKHLTQQLGNQNNRFTIKQRNNNLMYASQPSQKDNSSVRRNQSLLQVGGNRRQDKDDSDSTHIVRQNRSSQWNPVTVDSFAPSVEIAQNIPLSQSNSEYGGKHPMRKNISPQVVLASNKPHQNNYQRKGQRAQMVDTENESEKLDDSIRSPSIKSESVSVHVDDEEPQSMSEDQFDNTQQQVHPIVTYKKIEPPQSAKHKIKYLSPAFNYEEKQDDSYINVEESGIQVNDLDSHNQKSEKLNVFSGDRRKYARHASPMGCMSASQVSSYQIVDVNMDQENSEMNASQERFFNARNVPRDFHQNVRPFDRQNYNYQQPFGAHDL